MKHIKKNLLILIALLTVPTVLFGQTKTVTREEFYSTLKTARENTDKQIRKRVQVQKLFSNGKITSSLTDNTEYLPPDKSRWIYIEEEGNTVKRTETITIGNSVYKKVDTSAWTKREKDGEGFGISGTDDSTREFFIEEATVEKEKFQVLTEKTVNYNKTYFDERKIWINKKGLILKEVSTTSFNDLKNIVSSVEVTYDYKIKPPKIEAPIK